MPENAPREINYAKRLKELEPAYIRAKHEPEQMLAENALAFYAKIVPFLRRLEARPPNDNFSGGIAIGQLLELWNQVKTLKWPAEVIAEYEDLKKRLALLDEASKRNYDEP